MLFTLPIAVTTVDSHCVQPPFNSITKALEAHLTPGTMLHSTAPGCNLARETQRGGLSAHPEIPLGAFSKIENTMPISTQYQFIS